MTKQNHDVDAQLKIVPKAHMRTTCQLPHMPLPLLE